MADHDFSVLCKKAIIDSNSNNISLMEVVNDIHITIPKDDKSELINLTHPMDLVVQFSRSKSNIKEKKVFVKISRFGPDGKEHDDGLELELELVTSKTSRANIHIPSILIKNKQGTNKFEVRYKSKKSDRWKLASNVKFYIFVNN